MVYGYQNLKEQLNTSKGKQLADIFKQEYEKNYKDTPITVLNYSMFKEIHTTGNRTNYEDGYFQRFRRLNLLQLLALADDSYLQPLEELLSVMCGEFTWILPAHCRAENFRFNYNVVDLFSAETGFYLAETAYIFKEKLGGDIVERINKKLKENITDIFENVSSWWEIGEANNWASVCAGSIGAVYLYSFPERFPIVKDRIFHNMQRYLTSINEDGTTGEGVSYWEYGFGFFAIFFDLYKQFTGETHELLNQPKVQKSLDYINYAKMQGNIYLPFADGGAPEFKLSPFIAGAVKNLFGNNFIAPEYTAERIKEGLGFRKALSARLINGLKVLENKEKKSFDDIYYSAAQIFIKKTDAYAFAAKCGHNLELHNHNDIGGFQIVSNQKRLIADLGAGEYTREFFGPGRYGDDIFVCGAKSHSIPEIDGIIQTAGEYSGEVLSADENSFEMDLAGAYPGFDGKFLRSFKLSKNTITLNETLKSQKPVSVVYRFVSEYKPEIKNGKVYIENMSITFDSSLKATVTVKPYSGHYRENFKAYVIDFTSGEKHTDDTKQFVFGFDK